MASDPLHPAPRVLVVDDNRAIHEDFRKILQRERPDRTALADAKKALFGRVAAPSAQADFEIESALQRVASFQPGDGIVELHDIRQHVARLAGRGRDVVFAREFE